MQGRHPYDVSKPCADLIAHTYAVTYQLPVAITRSFAFVGPYLPLGGHFAIGNFIRDALQAGPIQVRGDGMPYRSYRYSADLAILLWTIPFKGQPCRPYNIGSEAVITIKTLAHAVADVFEPRPEVRVLKKAKSSTPPDRYVPSTRRATKELELNQHADLAEAIRRTVIFEQLRRAIG